jgi:hypothetical protein
MTPRNEPYPASPGHRGNDTSIAAAAAIAGVSGSLRRLVHATIFDAGVRGITTDEIAAALGMPRYSVPPRTTELRHARSIRDSGRRRQNASGCKAIVWRATILDERETVS